MDFDTILDEVGSFGIYQKVVICFVLLPAALPCAFHAYRWNNYIIIVYTCFQLIYNWPCSQLFIAATPKHWCRVPELDPWALDYMHLVKNLSIPLVLKNGEYQYSECEMYKRNYTEIVRYLEHRAPMDLIFGRVQSIEDPTGAPIIKCNNGWKYDKSMYPVTVASEVSIYKFWIYVGRSYLSNIHIVLKFIFVLLNEFLWRNKNRIWKLKLILISYKLL